LHELNVAYKPITELLSLSSK